MHSQRFRSAHPAGHDNRRNLHFDQQGGTRGAGAIGSKVSPAGPVVEHDSDPADLTPYDVLRMWKRRGVPVLYEYKDGHRSATLSYPVKDKSRNWYHEGDIVLINDVEKRYAERMIPELKQPDDEFSILNLVMLLLGEHEDEKFKLAWKILLISDVGAHGTVVIQRVILFDNVPTLLKTREMVSVDELAARFIYTKTGQQLESLIPVLEFTVELSETLLVGELEAFEKIVGKRLLKTSARFAMKRGFKKALNITLRTAANAVFKASLAFLNAFLKEFLKDKHALEEQLRIQKQLGSTNLPKEIETHPIFKKAVLAGADAAALALVKECLEKPLMKTLDKSLEQMYPLGDRIERPASQRVSIYLSKEIVKFCTTEFASSIIDGLLSAWKGSLDATGKVDPVKRQKLFEGKLLSALSNAFTKRLDSWLESVGEQEFEDMKL